MDSSSGISSNSSGLQNSGSEGDLQQLIDQRKQKRMISNRESARRSRLRKQKHLDELMIQVAQLRKDNQIILNNLNVTSHHYVNVEAENAILRAQTDELSHRLHSLNEIVSFMSSGNGGIHGDGMCYDEMDELAGFLNNDWSCFNQPIAMAAAAANTAFLY